MRCAFCTPILGPWASDPETKKMGGAISGTPILGTSWSLAFFEFWTLEHQRNTWTTLTPSDTQPIDRKTTHPGANLNRIRSLASPSPTLGVIYTKVAQSMARQSYTSSTLRGTDPPHRGGVRPPSSLLHHEAKEQVQFWSPPRLTSGSLALFCSFGLLSISEPPGPTSHIPIPNLSSANPLILGRT